MLKKMMMVAISLVVLVSCRERSAETDEVNAQHIRAMLAPCYESIDHCLGGFIKYHGNPHFYRLSWCDDNCRGYEVGIRMLLDAGDLNLIRIKSVVLPFEEDLWEKTLMLYGRQYLVPNMCSSENDG